MLKDNRGNIDQYDGIEKLFFEGYNNDGSNFKEETKNIIIEECKKVVMAWG